MIKVLIADDEPMIREGLTEMVEWNLYSMKVMATCADGELAIAQIDANMPDLCVLDVCMPYSDGLEVAKYFKAKNPLGEIIFISGHDEFTYAQQAIRIGAHHYLLKPINFRELSGILQSVSQIILKRNTQTQNMREVNKMLNKNMNVLKTNFMESLLAGGCEAEDIEVNMRFFNMPYTDDVMLYVIKNNFSTNRDEKIDVCAIENAAIRSHEQYTCETFISGDGHVVLLCWEDKDLSQSIAASLPPEIKCSVYSQRVTQFMSNPYALCEAYCEIQARVRSKETVLPIVRKLTQYIEENYSAQSISIDEFAKNNSISHGYLCRLFKQEQGITWRQYLANYRTNKAIEYLQDPTLKIYNIAELVGFKTQHYFCEIFTQNTGFSPTEFRKRFTEVT